MNLFKLSAFIGLGMASVLALVPTKVDAQNLQSVTNYSRTHEKLLASQAHIQDQIRLEETQKYANQLFDDSEPEPDIYNEGWQSGLVNSYKNAIVPDSRVIDVRKFSMPCPGRVTSNYGYRPRFRRMHKGIDLGIRTGDTIYAAFDGKVRLTKYERGGYGFYVILRHDNGLETVYGHLSRFLVRPDQYVKAGTPIALGGSTGRSTGPHLHFETRFMGYAINPAAIFDFSNQTTHTDTYTFTKRTYEQARDYSPSASKYRAAASSKKNPYKRGGSKSTYKIRRGDNLGKIAARNGVSVSELCRLNGISKNSKIKAGKVLRVR